MDHIIGLPQPILDLDEAHKAMCKHFAHPRLKFTLHGRLLGTSANSWLQTPSELICVMSERTALMGLRGNIGGM
ncbi:hypothetical protein [Ensifer canadensis]